MSMRNGWARTVLLSVFNDISPSLSGIHTTRSSRGRDPGSIRSTRPSHRKSSYKFQEVNAVPRAAGTEITECSNQMRVTEPAANQNCGLLRLAEPSEWDEGRWERSSSPSCIHACAIRKGGRLNRRIGGGRCANAAGKTSLTKCAESTPQHSANITPPSLAFKLTTRPVVDPIDRTRWGLSFYHHLTVHRKTSSAFPSVNDALFR